MNGYTADPVGDMSSKRLAGFVLLGTAVAIGLFSAGLGCFTEIPAANLIQNIFFGLLGASMTAFGLTIPEHFSKTMRVEEGK